MQVEAALMLLSNITSNVSYYGLYIVEHAIDNKSYISCFYPGFDKYMCYTSRCVGSSVFQKTNFNVSASYLDYIKWKIWL